MKNKEIGAMIKSKAVEKIAREVTASLLSSREPSSPNPTQDRRTPDSNMPTPPKIFPDKPFTDMINPSDRERVFF